MNKKEMLLEYIKVNVGPIIVDFLSGNDFDNAVILTANVGKEELTGHYEDTNYLPPKWLENILGGKRLLFIDKIDSISIEEQLKFIELLKYKKISTFDLPKETIIIITAKEMNKDIINEEILSLAVRI